MNLDKGEDNEQNQITGSWILALRNGAKQKKFHADFALSPTPLPCFLTILIESVDAEQARN